MKHNHHFTTARIAVCGALLMLSAAAPAADGSWITGTPRADQLTKAPFEACQVPFVSAAPFAFRYRPCWE